MIEIPNHTGVLVVLASITIQSSLASGHQIIQAQAIKLEMEGNPLKLQSSLEVILKSFRESMILPIGYEVSRGSQAIAASEVRHVLRYEQTFELPPIEVGQRYSFKVSLGLDRLAVLASCLLFGLGILAIFFVHAIFRALEEVIRKFNQEQSRAIELVAGGISEMTNSNQSIVPSNWESEILEVNQFFESSGKFAVLVSRLQQRIETLVYSEALFKIARGVSHDIRAPLSALEAVILSSNVTLEERKLVQQISQRIRSIAENLLRQGSNEKTFSEQIARSRIEDVINQIISEKRAMYPEVDIQFNSKTSLQLEEVPLWQRNLSNLIENSIQAMGGDHPKCIYISASESESDCDIVIDDTGRGIPGHILNRLGQEGFTWGKVGGSGIGLFEVKKFIQSLGGSIQIESEVGKGTRVILRFPKGRA